MAVGIWGYLNFRFFKYKKQLPTACQTCAILVSACVIVVLFIGEPRCLTQARTRMVQVWYEDETMKMDNKRRFQEGL
jgi:hypothetical protein